MLHCTENCEKEQHRKRIKFLNTLYHFKITSMPNETGSTTYSYKIINSFQGKKKTACSENDNKNNYIVQENREHSAPLF